MMAELATRLAVIDLPIRAWSEVAAHNGELVAFLTPSLV